MKEKLENLRNIRAKGSVLPDIKERMNAGHVLDEILGSDSIPIPGGNNVKTKTRGGMQKSSGLAVVGSDVVSLFPSLKNIESARLARKAILESEVDVGSFDHLKALRYIFVVGGRELLSKRGLTQVSPKWTGDRPYLLAVGGEASQADDQWKDTARTVFDSEKKMIFATVVEIAVNTAMSTHIYSFCGQFYLQKQGGSIGLTLTASLASLIMKMWDRTWLKLMKREGIDILSFFRYVDDMKNFLRPLAEGWRWTGDQFEFKSDWEQADRERDVSDQARTTEQLVKAMYSVVDYLQFEGESSEMFNGRLPTLDCEIWFEEEENDVKFSFFEKPMCPNRVLPNDTALSETSIRASLVQEIVRRLKCCSRNLPVAEKQKILSVFCTKLVNSGHSVASAQYMLVHGVTRFNKLVENSDLPESHQNFKPLYPDRNFNVIARKLHKILSKSGWYDDLEIVKKTRWRESLPNGWMGDRQYSAPGMSYTTLIQVPSSVNGRLTKRLARAEPRVAKLTGYQTKIVEKGGTPLSRMFPKNFSSPTCGRIKCNVCKHHTGKKPSLCQVKSVIYSATCILCESEWNRDKTAKHKGKYIGETSRTLSERAFEHLASLRRYDMSSFMLKHWSICHAELLEPPKFTFKVLKRHKDPLSRLVHEAILILDKASMNEVTR